MINLGKGGKRNKEYSELIEDEKRFYQRNLNKINDSNI